MNIYSIQPVDLLFFRDGRPMETGEGLGGHGARWPFPTVFFDALHAALHRAFPETAGETDWERRHEARPSANGRTGQLRFGNLRTLGPFPQRGSSWLFPAPLDVRPDPNGKLHASRPMSMVGCRSNLPKPLSLAVASSQPPTKDPVPPWWSAEAMETYLSGQPVESTSLPETDALWVREATTGIGTDPLRGTQDGRRIYSALYLRLAPDVTLGCAATLPAREAGEALRHLFPDTRHIVCGGQQRVCSVEEEAAGLSNKLPKTPEITGNRVKWVLLSPAVFPKSPDHPGGWLPSWIDPESGEIRLPREKAPRKPGEPRAVWRKRWQSGEPIKAKLVAAYVGKPEVVTGWSDLIKTRDGMQGSGKSTRLAVPAGSVYYFEGEDASLLSRLLSWDGQGDGSSPRTLSGAMGEKGLGLGVCAPWHPFD